jgi:hypothetical protein
MLNPFREVLAAAILLTSLTLTGPLMAQSGGIWRATSSNAKSITGDVVLSDQKITINFLNFTMVRVRDLENPELSAAFDADPSARGGGSLYRLQIPSSVKFLHKNTLCGTDDTEWMALYVAGRTLQLAFFSGDKPPVFTLEALSNSSDVCGTFTYGY